ncbi:hypothetical protein IAU59_002778 [Kwoniella sp. CBS 9459]
MPPKSRPTSNVQLSLDYVYPQGEDSSTTFRVRPEWRPTPEHPFSTFTHPDIKLYEKHAPQEGDKPVTADTHHITGQAMFGEDNAPLPIQQFEKATSELTCSLYDALDRQKELDDWSQDLLGRIVNYDQRLLEDKPISLANLSISGKERVLETKDAHRVRSEGFTSGNLRTFRDQLDVSREVLSMLPSRAAVTFQKEMLVQLKSQEAAITKYLNDTRGDVNALVSMTNKGDPALVDDWCELAKESATSNTIVATKEVHRNSDAVFKQSPSAASVGDLYEKKLAEASKRAGIARMRYRGADHAFGDTFRTVHPDRGIPRTVQDWADMENEESKRIGAVRLRSVLTRPIDDTSTVKLHQIPEYSLDGRQTYRPFPDADRPGGSDNEWRREDTNVTVSTALNGTLPSQELIRAFKEAGNDREKWKQDLETDRDSQDPITQVRVKRMLEMIDVATVRAPAHLQKYHQEVTTREDESFADSIDDEYDLALEALDESSASEQQQKQDGETLALWKGYVEDSYRSKASTSRSDMLQTAKEMVDKSRFPATFSQLDKKLQSEKSQSEVAKSDLQVKKNELSSVVEEAYGLTSIPSTGADWTEAFSQRAQ